MQSPTRARSQMADVRTSPFTLWEGGADPRASRAAGTSIPEGELVVALPAEPLPLDFGERSLPEPAAAPRTAAARKAASPADRRARTRGLVAMVSLAVACALLVIAFSLAEGAAMDGYRASLVWEPHEVVAGESIGSILQGRDLPPVESGRIVHWVEEENDLPNATIYPGQVLLVPTSAARG